MRNLYQANVVGSDRRPDIPGKLPCATCYLKHQAQVDESQKQHEKSPPHKGRGAFWKCPESAPPRVLRGGSTWSEAEDFAEDEEDLTLSDSSL